MIKDFAIHPVDRIIRHVDFVEVKLDKRSTWRSHRHEHDPPASPRAASSTSSYRMLPIQCLPGVILKVEVDVTHLELGYAIATKDGKLPDGVVARVPPSRRSSQSSHPREGKGVEEGPRLRHRRGRSSGCTGRSSRRAWRSRTCRGRSAGRGRTCRPREKKTRRRSESSALDLVSHRRPRKSGKYEAHRHNVGFMTVDRLTGAAGSPAWKEKFSGRVPRGDDVVAHQADKRTLNVSGDSVQPAAAFVSRAATVIVVHDRLDLPFGDVRIKSGGGHAVLAARSIARAPRHARVPPRPASASVALPRASRVE